MTPYYKIPGKTRKFPGNFFPRNKMSKNPKCFKIFFRLELNMELPAGQLSSIGASTVVSQEQDELTQRLARLRE